MRRSSLAGIALLMSAAACMPAAGAGPAAADPRSEDHTMSPIASPAVIDEENPADCPAWVKETTPAWLDEFKGRRGAPEPLRSWTKPFGEPVRGIDRWQANHAIALGPRTAEYLYGSYTPLTVAYRRGTLPTLEQAVAEHTDPKASARENALRLLTEAMPKLIRHPTMPPLAAPCRPDRNLDDEALVATGTGFCNEQARVYVRLCQVAGIPARMVFTWYEQGGGHVIAEFHDGKRWAMVESTYLCAFPDDDGRLLSAADSLDAANRPIVARAYQQCLRRILNLNDEGLVGGYFPDRGDPARQEKVAQRAGKVRATLEQQLATGLHSAITFVMLLNYPLPETPAD
jgi:hypothetical protein